MCGRYTLTQEQEALQVALGVPDLLHERPRFNVAPTQEMPVILGSPTGCSGARMRWGLVPSWAEDPSVGSRMINARAESAHETPSFRVPFRRSRCLVPADGFFEWREEGGRKIPYHIRLASGASFTFAGLWDRWRGPGGDEVESFTILTRDAVPSIRALHHRMPVLVAAGNRDRWLDAGTPPRELRELLLEAGGDAILPAPLLFHAVSTRVNSPRNDDPECVVPVGEDPGPVQGTLFR